jgi:hypothetical protein
MEPTLKILERLKAQARVDELVDSLSKETGLGADRVARELYSLREDGKLQIVEPTVPSNLLEYMRRPYGMWVTAIFLFIFLTLFSIFVLPQSAPYIYIRYISGSLFVLYLPGYSLIEALYSKADELDQLERLALSIGLSLALVPLVGLLLNYTPWGIRLTPILVSLIILTIALTLISAWRKLLYVRLSAVGKG